MFVSLQTFSKMDIAKELKLLLLSFTRFSISVRLLNKVLLIGFEINLFSIFRLANLLTVDVEFKCNKRIYTIGISSLLVRFFISVAALHASNTIASSYLSF